MLKLLTVIISLTSSFTQSFAEDVKCTIAENAHIVRDAEIVINVGSKGLFFDSPDYRFFLTNKGLSKFELEIYDAYSATRSYSAGYLRTNQDELSWAFWSREVLLETTCKLNQ